MSYTALLFDNLKKAASPGAVAEATHGSSSRGQASYTFAVPPVDSIIRDGSSSGYGGSDRRLETPGTPAGQVYTSIVPADTMPAELDECYAVIRFQRAQIMTLRGRLGAVEEELLKQRERVLASSESASASQGAGGAASGEDARASVAALSSELARVKEDKMALSRKVLDQQRRMEELRATAEREKAELAFKLGKDAALAAAPPSSFSDSSLAPSGGATPARGGPIRKGTGVKLEAPSTDSSAPIRSLADLGLQVDGGDAGETAQDAPGSPTSEGTPAAEPPSSAASELRAGEMKRGSALAASRAMLKDITTAAAASAAVQPAVHSTAMLVARQQHVHAQEQALLAMKQKGAQARLMSMQQAAAGSHGGGGAYGMPSPGAGMWDRTPYGGAAGLGMGGNGTGFSSRNVFGGTPGGSGGYMGSAGGGMYSGGGMPPSGGMYGGGADSTGYSSRNLLGGGPRGVPMPGSYRGGMPNKPMYGAHSGGAPGTFGMSSGGDMSHMHGGGMDGGGGMMGSNMGGDNGMSGLGPPQLPEPGSEAAMTESAFPPNGGWTPYQHPPSGVKWPENMPFFGPLVSIGFPFMKHGRLGRPHQRLMWMDISEPSDPQLVWHEGNVRDAGKVKEKDRMRLIEIIDIRAGRVSENLKRSGREHEQDKYMVFQGENRTLDVEMVSPEARDWLFKKFADLFQAYATAQKEKLAGEAVTHRVAQIMDTPGAVEATRSTGASPTGPGGSPMAPYGRPGAPGGMGGMPGTPGMMPHYGSARPGGMFSPMSVGGGGMGSMGGGGMGGGPMPGAFGSAYGGMSPRPSFPMRPTMSMY